MFRLLAHIPLAGIILYMIAGKSSGFDVGVMRIAGLIITAGVAATVYVLGRRHQASLIHKGMAAFLLLAALAVWFWPDGAGRIFAKYPVALLYAVLFLVAAGPPLAGREVFTMYFARQTTPPAVWSTDIFKTINYHLTALWAALFFCGIISGMIPGLFNLHGPFFETLFEGLLPTAFMLGIGVPANKRYPEYYQRKLGLEPVAPDTTVFIQGPESAATDHHDKPELKVSKKKTDALPAQSCKDLLRMMPLGLDSQAAQGLEAIYQFEVSGEEEFIAHIKISDCRCSFHEGPAEAPAIVVKTPADVWLAISSGKRDGQQAFMNGDYTAEGDMNLLLKLKSLFRSPGV